MKRIATIALLLALSAPGFAGQLEDRIADGERWVNLMDWVKICTTDQPVIFSEADRLATCLEIERQLRDHGSCMYSPGVLGIWNGKHCR